MEANGEVARRFVCPRRPYSEALQQPTPNPPHNPVRPRKPNLQGSAATEQIVQPAPPSAISEPSNLPNNETAHKDTVTPQSFRSINRFTVLLDEAEDNMLHSPLQQANSPPTQSNIQITRRPARMILLGNPDQKYPTHSQPTSCHHHNHHPYLRSPLQPHPQVQRLLRSNPLHRKISRVSLERERKTSKTHRMKSQDAAL